MAAKFPVTSTFPLFLCFVVLTLLAGCAGLGGTSVTGLQFNPIAQENNQRAQKAMAVALEQTCEAAKPYREAAQSAAAASAALATESNALTNDIRSHVDQQGKLMHFLNQSRDKIAASQARLAAAKAEFEKHFRGGRVSPTETLSHVIEDAGAYTQAMQDLARTLDQVSGDFDLLLLANKGKIETYFTDHSGAPLDPNQLATNFRRDSYTWLETMTRFSYTPYSVPADTNIPVGALPRPTFDVDYNRPGDMYFDFQTTMSQIKSQGEHHELTQALGSWAAVADATEWAADVADARIGNASDRIAIITDRTQEYSAEATRNAWLAVEACGGTLPEDLPPLSSPFDSANTMIPGWDSTFWDISSP
jgi:hypothetical protein